jgi:hypothetical protein
MFVKWDFRHESFDLYYVSDILPKTKLAANLIRKDIGYLRLSSGVQFLRIAEAQRVDAFPFHSIRKTNQSWMKRLFL